MGMQFGFEVGSGAAVNFWKVTLKQKSCCLEEEC